MYQVYIYIIYIYVCIYIYIGSTRFGRPYILSKFDRAHPQLIQVALSVDAAHVRGVIYRMKLCNFPRKKGTREKPPATSGNVIGFSFLEFLQVEMASKFCQTQKDQFIVFLFVVPLNTIVSYIVSGICST